MQHFDGTSSCHTSCLDSFQISSHSHADTSHLYTTASGCLGRKSEIPIGSAKASWGSSWSCVSCCCWQQATITHCLAARVFIKVRSVVSIDVKEKCPECVHQYEGFPPSMHQYEGFPPSMHQSEGFPPSMHQYEGFAPSMYQYEGFLPACISTKGFLAVDRWRKLQLCRYSIT